MRIHFYQTSFLDELEPTARNYEKRTMVISKAYLFLFIYHFQSNENYGIYGCKIA